MKKNKLAAFFIVVCIMIAAGCVGYIVYYYSNKAANEQAYDKLKEEVRKPEITPTGEAQEETAEEPEDAPYVSPIDFEKLWSVNPDIYAWIEIPDTNIAYPVVQSPDDNAYYLDHTVEGNSGYPGSIYTENYNSRDFTDYCTVVYGHNMKDGSMFADLHKYEDQEFMNSHSEVYLYLPDRVLKYRIFSAVVYDDRHILHSFAFDSESGRQQFLDSLAGSRDMRNTVDTSVPVTADDQVLMMSTCIGSEPDHRWVVGAVLEHE